MPNNKKLLLPLILLLIFSTGCIGIKDTEEQQQAQVLPDETPSYLKCSPSQVFVNPDDSFNLSQISVNAYYENHEPVKLQNVQWKVANGQGKVSGSMFSTMNSKGKTNLICTFEHKGKTFTKEVLLNHNSNSNKIADLELNSHNSAVFDKQGFFHVLSRDLYIKTDGSFLHKETLYNLEDVIENSDVKVDSSGFPHIVYSDKYQTTIKYRYLTAEGWKTETVADAKHDESRVALFLDENDFPHVIYIDYNQPQNHEDNTVSYAYRAGNNQWIKEAVTVMKSGGHIYRMQIDASGVLHALFRNYSEKNLVYAYRTGGKWSDPEILDDGLNQDFLFFEIDSNGSLCASYLAHKRETSSYHLSMHRITEQAGTLKQRSNLVKAFKALSQ